MDVQRRAVIALVSLAAPLSILIPPTASADCTNAGAATVCAQGDVRGGGPTAPLAGPAYPSYCADPWYCDDNWGVDVILPLPPRPGWPGGPGRPGGGIDIGPR